MKTVLKATKRFAAVFLALAMIVLSLPSSLMEVQAAAAGTNILPATISGGSHVSFAISPTTVTASGSGVATVTATTETGYVLPDASEVTTWTVTLAPASGGTAAATVGAFNRNDDTTATANIDMTDIGAEDEATMTATLGGEYAGVASTFTVTPGTTGTATEGTDFCIGTTGSATSTDVDSATYDADLEFYIVPTATAISGELNVNKVFFTSAATAVGTGKQAATDMVIWPDQDGKYTIPNKYVTGNITINVDMSTTVNTIVGVETPANVDVTVSGAGYDNVSGVWSSGTLTVVYELASGDYSWAVAPTSADQFYVSVYGGLDESLSDITGATFKVLNGVATITLPADLIGSPTLPDNDIVISTDIAASGAAGTVTVTPATDNIYVDAGETLPTGEDAYSYTAAVAGDDDPSVTWGLYDGNDISTANKVNIDGVSLVASGVKATLTGTPTDCSQSGTYYAIAKSGTETGYATIVLNIYSRDTDAIIVSDTGKEIGPRNFNFGEKEVGYSAITGKTVKVKNSGSNPIKDVTFAMSGGASSSFTVSPSNITELAKGQTVTLTITPKTGLNAKADGYGETLVVTSKAFSGSVTPITDARGTTGASIDNSVKIADAVFSVKDDVSFYVGNKEVELSDTPWQAAAPDGSKEFVIGTYTVGQKIPQVTIKTTESGVTQGLDIDMTETDAAMAATPFSDIVVLSTSAIKHKKTDASAKTSWASFDILTSDRLPASAYDFSAANVTAYNTTRPGASGKDVRVAYNSDLGVTEYYLPVHVVDEAGINRMYYGIIRVQPTSSYTVKVGTKTLTDGSTYSWSDSTNSPVTVEITNTSDVDLTFSAAELANTNLTLAGNSDITIPAGGSDSFTVKAAAATDTKETVTINGGASGVTAPPLYSKGIDPIQIGFSFTKKGDHIRITTPSDVATTKTTSTTSELDDGAYGSSYRFQFEASEDAKWYLLGNDVTLTDGSGVPGITTTGTGTTYWYNSLTADSANGLTTPASSFTTFATPTMMTDYGFTLVANSGILTAPAILNPDADGKIIAVLAVDTTNNEAVVGYYKLSVTDATAALTVVDESGESVDEDTPYATSTTTSGGKIVETFTVTNTSAVDLEKIYANSVAYTPDGGADAHNDVELKWVKDDGSKVAADTTGIDIGSHQSVTLEMTFKDDTFKGATSKKTYGAKVQFSRTTAIMDFPVEVEVSTLPGVTIDPNALDAYGKITMNHSGDPITVDDEITSAKGIQLTGTVVPGGEPIDSQYAEIIWRAQSGSTVPAGLRIEGNKIVGTPTKTGTFLVTFVVTNNTPGDHYGEQGEVDATIEVSGATSVSLYGKSTDLVSTYGAYTDPFLFDGVIAGSSTSLAPLNVTVKNEGTVATGALVIDIDDSVDGDGKTVRADDSGIDPGSKNKFTLSTTGLDSIAVGGDLSFTIVPNETVAAGTYNAVVTVSGDGIKSESFYVQYTVVEETQQINISSKLSKTVGDALDEGFVVYGAGSDDDENGQTAEYYMNVKKDGVPDKDETWALVEELQKVGFQTSASTAGTIKATNKNTDWTGHGYKINGGKFAVAALKGAGDFEFDVYAYVDEVDSTAMKVPTQYDEETVNMTIAPTTKVYVLDTENYNNGSVESTPVSSATGADKKVTSYKFQNQAPGYDVGAGNVIDTITVKFDSTQTVKLDATVVNADKTSSANFTISDKTGLNAVGNGANGTFTITPKAGADKNEKLEAFILIKADTNDNPGAFADIMIPVSMTVEPAVYAYKIFDPLDAEELPLTKIDLGNIIKGDAAASTNFTIKNTGNTKNAGTIKFTEVLDAEGTTLGTKDTPKLSTAPAYRISADIATLNRNAMDTITITPKKVDEVGKQTAYMMVTFPNQTESRVFEVNYTVISDDASASLDPNGAVSLTTKKENYNEFSQTFTIKNTGSSATDVLKNVTVVLAGHGAFSLDEETKAIIAENGNDILVPDLEKGKAKSFNLVVAEGLETGTYAATLTVDADNLKSPIIANVTFKVTADENLSVNASANIGGSLTGEVLSGTRATRLMKTLSDMFADEDVHVYQNNINSYTVNFNGPASATDYDVSVQRVDSKVTIAVGSKCDVTSAKNTLTNAGYESADLGTAFKKVDFTIMEYVVIDMMNASNTAFVRNDADTAYVEWTDADTAAYGTNGQKVVYKVPYGETITSAQASLYNAALTTKSTRPSFSGLPEGMVFASDNTVGTAGDASLDSWFDGDALAVFDETAAITKNYTNVFPKKHVHTYAKAKAGDQNYISWSWEDDYSAATLFLTCDANDYQLETVAVVTSKPTKLTCTQDGSTEYTAKATVDGVEYTDVKQSAVTKATGHKWTYVKDSLKWSADKSTATITLECLCDEHDAAIDGVPKIRTNVEPDSITPSASDASCIKEGTYKNYAVWYDNGDVTKILFEATSSNITGFGPHNYSKNGTFTWNFPTNGTPTASLNVKCLNAADNSAHDLNVLASGVSMNKYHEYSNGDTVWQAYYFYDKDHEYSELKTVKANGSIVSGDDKSLEYDGLETEVYYNNGKAITQPNLKVYWGDDLLKLNTDYSLTYADNKEVGSATVTITGKGNYAETKVLNYRIVPASVEWAQVTAGVATKSAAMPYKETTKPKLTYGGKALKMDTDFYVVDSDGEGYGFDENGVKTVTLKGLGNFTGSTQAKIYATDNKNVFPASKLTVTIDSKNVASTESFEKVYPNSITISYGKNFKRTITNEQMKSDGGSGTIGNDGDTVKFNYEITNNYIPGTASVTIFTDELITVDSGKQMIGATTKTYKIAGQSLTKAVATFVDNSGKTVELTNKTEVPFMGTDNPYVASSFTDFKVTVGAKELTEYTDYYVTYANNNKAGTATFTINGMGAYTGAKVNKTFKITKPTFAGNTEIKVTFTDGQTYAEVPYVQGGAKPSIQAVCTVNGNVLVEGTDYTLSYKNNTKVGQTATVTVTGKGNYQGKNAETLTFKVTQRELNWTPSGIGESNSLNYGRTDVKFNSSKLELSYYLKGKKPVVNEVVGYTEDGFEVVKKLTENRDYTFTGKWYYDDGTLVGSADTVSAESVYTDGLLLYAEIIPGGTSGSYKGDAVLLPSVFIYGTQMKANMIEVNQNIFFTGGRITQESVEGGIITNLDTEDYEIMGYKNNTKQGTATVTVRGWGPYGGTVNKTFRIQKANINKQ